MLSTIEQSGDEIDNGKRNSMLPEVLIGLSGPSVRKSDKSA